jgi:hypothetical protein
MITVSHEKLRSHNRMIFELATEDNITVQQRKRR